MIIAIINITDRNSVIILRTSTGYDIITKRAWKTVNSRLKSSTMINAENKVHNVRYAIGTQNIPRPYWWITCGRDQQIVHMFNKRSPILSGIEVYPAID